MNHSINILFKKIFQLPIRSNCLNLQFKKFSSSSITKTFFKSNQKFLKISKQTSIFFVRKIKIGGSNVPYKKEKITYNGIRRLLGLAAPEKYKLMGIFDRFTLFFFLNKF